MVPCAAQGWYSVFVNEPKPASVLFRAYIRRKPSGLLLVTVQSTKLPRPVFRSYPLDIGEAAAVERSVGHALAVVFKLEGAGVKLGVNHPVMPPHADQQSADKCDCQPANNHSKVKSVFKHYSPHGLHQPCQHAAVRSDEQAGAEGYAVNGGHLAASQLVSEVQEAPHEGCTKQNIDKLMCCGITNAAFNKEAGAASSAQTPQQSPEAPTQHLRLRVVWQGFLT